MGEPTEHSTGGGEDEVKSLSETLVQSHLDLGNIFPSVHVETLARRLIALGYRKSASPVPMGGEALSPEPRARMPQGYSAPLGTECPGQLRARNATPKAAMRKLETLVQIFETHLREVEEPLPMEDAALVRALVTDLRAAGASGWMEAIEAAAKICVKVADGARDQGIQLRRPASGTGNPNAHRSGEIRLGAMRCHDAIRDLTLPTVTPPEGGE